MYTVCVPFVVWLKQKNGKKIKNTKLNKINSAKAFIAVPLPSLTKGGGKFFNVRFSQVDILYYYKLLQMLDLLQMFSLLTA